MNQVKTLKGIVIPSVTPFDEMGELRLDWLQANIQSWNQTAVGGYMVLGSNGEFRSLNDEEALAVIETAAEYTAADKLLIAGAGRESLYQTIAFIGKMEKKQLSVDYISVLTPGYFKGAMTDEALVDYYEQVADYSPYPVLIYCAPKFANGVCVSKEAIRRLADHPNIAGIKDTSSDMMESYMEAVGGRDDFEVFSGSLGNIMSCMRHGGKGGIISGANYFPNTCVKLYELFCKGDEEAVNTYFVKLKHLTACTGGSAGVAGVKAAMNLMGLKGGMPRKPVLPCAKELVDSMNTQIICSRDWILDRKKQ